MGEANFQTEEVARRTVCCFNAGWLAMQVARRGHLALLENLLPLLLGMTFITRVLNGAVSVLPLMETHN